MKNKLKIDSSLKDIFRFIEIPSYRKSIIAEAPSTAVQSYFAVNSTANFLHPNVQYLRVKAVAEVSRDVRAYILEPDTSKGSASLAYFRPGQYISFVLNIGHSVVSRPYTICSSPLRSCDDEYMIVVRKIPHGFASQYIFNNWTRGTQVTASAPCGTLYYQPIRDCRNVIGICDGYGISGFLSMAEAICDGTLDMDLTVLYTARKRNEAILTERLDELSRESTKFKIVYVYSDERVSNCERGFITKQLIDKYAPKTKYSLFVSGTTQLYNRIMPHIAELKLEKKYIRFGLNGQISSPTSLSDFPQDAKGKTFLCKVIKDGKCIATIPCSSEETLLSSLEREGIKTDSACRSGECGYCRSQIKQGNVFIPEYVDSRRVSDSAHGVIHPCCSYPISNITLIIN